MTLASGVKRFWLAAVMLALCAAAAYALTHLFSGRGAWIHFGAMLGTIMAANVFFVIMPGQREMVKAKVESPRALFCSPELTVCCNGMTRPACLV